MLFIAELTHSPENCWARAENEEEAEDWIRNTGTRAEEAGVDVHGAWVTPNEHTFYFVVEAEEFASVTEFLGPPLLQDHDADISPVHSLEEAVDVVFED